jgi:hypothetical protein
VSEPRVELYWLPVGAGQRTGTVRRCTAAYEALAARRARRPRQPLFHAALRVWLDGEEFAIEMAPAWGTPAGERGVVGEGSVGRPWLGRFVLFRYEVRRWRGGVIPDRAFAVESPRVLDTDRARVDELLRAVCVFPTYTWGLDEQCTGDMWNSNSLISWLLAVSGHDLSAIVVPAGGRAPGWAAGAAVAERAVVPL